MAARSRGEVQPKPRADAYVGLLGLSLIALITAIIFGYLNYDQIKDKPKPVQMPASRAPVPAAPGPAVVPGMPPGAAGNPPVQAK